MDLNEGMLDRVLRVVVGLVLIAFPLGVFGIDRAYVWGWIGLVPLVTGLVGWCPLYRLLGRKTPQRPDPVRRARAQSAPTLVPTRT